LLNSPLFVCVCVCEEKIRGRMSSNLLILRLYDDRLEMERRRREQQEKEEQEARIKKERQIREVELCRTHCQRSTALLTLCTESLARWSVQQWQLKKVGATTIVLVLPR
jgi:S-adenosylmethionine/arginine decarboxylase-like enzyme